MSFYVGIDWASEAHAVCVLDRRSRVRWQGTVAHSAAGLAELLRHLRRFGPGLAIDEQPRGALEGYGRARARGCRHPHAIRILGRAWLRVIWRCWQDRVAYDPARHRAAAMLAA